MKRSLETSKKNHSHNWIDNHRRMRLNTNNNNSMNTELTLIISSSLLLFFQEINKWLIDSLPIYHFWSRGQVVINNWKAGLSFIIIKWYYYWYGGSIKWHQNYNPTQRHNLHQNFCHLKEKNRNKRMVYRRDLGIVLLKSQLRDHVNRIVGGFSSRAESIIRLWFYVLYVDLSVRWVVCMCTCHIIGHT